MLSHIQKMKEQNKFDLDSVQLLDKILSVI
jgi:hypothetical protein